MKLSNSTKCQLTADKVLEVAEGINKHWKKMRVCHNVAESINNVAHRQSISYSESTSLLVKIHCEGNSIETKAYEGKFH